MSGRRHVVVIGLDGVRPDSVRPETTPQLHRLMTEGACMRQHRSAFPTETRVNLATLVTGVAAQGHGIVANSFLLPGQGDDGRPIEPATPPSWRRMESDGGILLATALGEVLAAAGLELAVLSTGSLGAWNILSYARADRDGAAYNPRFPEHARPATFGAQVAARHGRVADSADATLSSHVVDVFTETLWPERRPAVTILWLAEPDNAQHYRGGPGSPGAKAALSHVDNLIGRLRAWRGEQPEHDAIDFVVLSDHGHVTVDAHISVADVLRAGGLRAGPALEPDVDIALVGGRAPAFWTRPADTHLLARALEMLAEQPWFDLAFSANGDADGIHGTVAGSFAYGLVAADSRRAAPLRIALKATSEPNAYGMPGLGAVDYDPGQLPVGGGMHGGLHAAEVGCLCVAHGPSFDRGVVSDHPSAVADILPTLLYLFGLDAPASIRGRVLRELFDGAAAPAAMTTATHALDLGRRQVRLDHSVVDGHAYFEPRR